MSQQPPDLNPYNSPATADAYSNAPKVESSDLTTVDWIICIFCSGIACIIGIIRLIQGKPNAGKMIGFALLFGFLWGIVNFLISAAMQVK